MKSDVTRLRVEWIYLNILSDTTRELLKNERDSYKEQRACKVIIKLIFNPRNQLSFVPRPNTEIPLNWIGNDLSLDVV